MDTRDSTTLGAYLTDRYIPAKLDLKAGSAYQLGLAVSLFERWHGSPVEMRSLSAKTVTEFLRHLVTLGRSAATVNSKRISIITIWRHAARNGVAPRFDPTDIPRMKPTKKLPTSWTPPDVAKIILHLKRPWLKVLCQFLYETGTRIGAAAAITWDDWDCRSRMVRLRPEHAKTSEEQFVRVSERLAAKIELLRHASSVRIFPIPANKRFIRLELKAACKAAGLPYSRRDGFQKLRRTCATWTAANSSAEVAARQLGHASVRTTLQFYIDPRFLPQIHAADILPPL